ncbi:uncharacterized protein A1O9_09125 [Exophiala aquamarina CBS 119918]|uniref:Dimethylaniline monooxygenase (N-oxide forming) n=1 Tax=Exophiala aquamarina CBS 119918 TaxID=1182545 RepID=A0A072P5Y2_9EURO|nr:uncharacterized protein A1O9_09125 [Exophiala aquamarina CBS 119918]KEF54683.1 hypothetical protein A1O9_09125 [Exophiala aquamarina CBS 119918]
MGDASEPRSSTSQNTTITSTFLPNQISRVAIIGAGPVGLAFAKYLLAEKHFSEIVVYEQRDTVGGIWNLSDNAVSRSVSVPQLDPWYGTRSSGSRREDGGGDGDALEFESPLYDYLETNIPKQLMAYCDAPFPRSAPLFPRHEAVLEYLERYAEDVKSLIRFSTKVRHVELGVEEWEGRKRDVWSVISTDLRTGVVEAPKRYDALVVANGHYTVPYVPSIAGLQEFNQRYPGVVLHSKAYRRPEDFMGKKVLVVGNSASGLDIATQIGKYAQKPVYLSARSVSAFGSLPPADWREDVDEVVEFLSSDDSPRGIRLRSGRIETGFDSVVFATGYFYNFPFLRGIDLELGETLITDGSRTRGLYQHLFHIEHPSLVFPVINLKVIPFPLGQNQAAVTSRVWSGRLALPRKEEMRNWERETMQQKGDGKCFHLKKFPEDAAQINELYLWAKEARRRNGLEGDGMGKLGMPWDERLTWMRSRFPEIRGAFTRRGKDRANVTHMEELGFDFDAWWGEVNREGRREELKMFREAKCPARSEQV